MAEYFGQHRETIYLVLAASVVLFPLLLGTLFGHIPRQILSTWALPLAAGTLVLIIGIRYFETTQSPTVRLALNIVFGLIWFFAGLTIFFRKIGKATEVQAAAERTARLFGIMFTLFGLIWISVSVFQFWKN